MGESAESGAIRDSRVCFVGDSYVAGVGDSSGLGWTGRVVAYAHARGLPVTAYNLGIRGDTSADVAARLASEVGRRADTTTELRVVLAHGTNDLIMRNGRRRLTAEDSMTATSRSLSWLNSANIPVIFVGLPPVGDATHDAAARQLDLLLADCSRPHGVTYVSVIDRLIGDLAWLDGVRDGDGAHPGSAGYQRYFEIVRDPLMRFLVAGS